jgi:glycosyltransferase involved in cell wall biosynthesis
MPEPHICFVAPQLFPVLSGDQNVQVIGGAEVQQNFIARGLQAAGFQVSIVTDDFGQPDEVEIDGLRVVKIVKSGMSLPIIRYFHPRLTSIWSAMRRADADIYYYRCAGAATFVAGLYARTHGKRFIYASACDLDFDRPRTKELFKGRGGWRDLQLFRAGLKMAHTAVAQHRLQVETYRRWHNNEAELIPSCYAPPTGEKSAPAGVVLWVSVMRKGKRPELFLKLAQLFPDIKFRMIGGISQASGDNDAEAFYLEIESSARSLSNVEFLGFLPYQEADQHFNEANLLVNTSDFEGFPNTFLQAWARGIPTVSFVNSGAKDEQGAIGFIANDLDEMQETVARLSADAVAWSRESKRCLKYFRANHSMPAVITRYRALIDHLKVRK